MLTWCRFLPVKGSETDVRAKSSAYVRDKPIAVTVGPNPQRQLRHRAADGRRTNAEFRLGPLCDQIASFFRCLQCA